MNEFDSSDFSSPAEVRRPPKTTIEVAKVAGGEIGRFTFEPGWKWSECIKPVAGTDTCQTDHLGYVVSGHLHVECDDGSTDEMGPGTVYRIPPGHDAWVIGDERVVLVEFQGARDYAKG